MIRRVEERDVESTTKKKVKGYATKGGRLLSVRTAVSHAGVRTEGVEENNGKVIQRAQTHRPYRIYSLVYPTRNSEQTEQENVPRMQGELEEADTERMR